MFGEITTDFTEIANDNFEDHLTYDDTLVDFFNEFLSLPSFSESIEYNKETGVFEVVSDAAESISRQISSTLHEYTSPLFTNPTPLSTRPMIDNRYTVLCLDREQGVQWIMKERLPLFLQSDCYFEYRLAKWLSQLDGNRMSRKQELVCRPSQCLRTSVGSLRQHTLSLLSQETTDDNRSSSSSPEPAPQRPNSPRTKDGFHTGVGVNLTETEAAEQCWSPLTPPTPTTRAVECLAAAVVNQALRAVVPEMGGRVDSDRSNLSLTALAPRVQRPAAGAPATERGQRKEERAGSDVSDEMEENDRNTGFHGSGIHGTRQGLEAFKSFLWGTPGEKILCLWMDIERLKTLHNTNTKNRHLIKMRSQYLLNSGLSALNVELLSRLDLASTPCWREAKLRLIQPCLSEALLFYWGRRFSAAHSGCEKRAVACLRLWQDRQLRPPAGVDPSPRYITLLPLRPDSCVPRAAPLPAPQSGGCSSSPVLGGRRMEQMLQALHVEPRAGYVFSRFCERSGNKLWENAIHFWSDLQEYHQLFYQNGLDLYRVQRKAQLLYSTYLCSAAQMSIGVDQGCRGQVLACLSSPFEVLFDRAEEHTLTLLLEPWTHLASQDRAFYDRVDLWEETRHVDSPPYAKLRALHAEAARRLEQRARERRPPPPPPEGSREPDLWAQVPDQFRGYRLGSLLRHRLELQHFHSFLEENFASMDLTCWLDIEQFKRTPHKDKALREERSRDVRSKYLNRKYFFGPNSPASKGQQEEVVHLAGGWVQLLRDRLCGPVLLEVQSLVRFRIERKWLPIFLATPQFFERQKRQPQVEDVVEDQIFLRLHKKRQVWKHVDGAWMASSKEVLAFRRALLNPVTCLQFQRFVALKGDFLENDVLFWLEVQRYKDLCHSHCDEATVQHKVTTIINCFIHSSIPPALQIDVPPEQARDILERRRELGPYVFREAQMSVFSELFKLWPGFLAFRRSVEEEQVLPVLESRRAKQKERLLRQRREETQEEEERRRTQEELEREKTSFADGLLEENGSEYEGSLEDGEKKREEELIYPIQQGRSLLQLSWSYSKYMAALEREEALLRRQAQQEQGLASFTTGSSSGHSSRSAGSNRCQRAILHPADNHHTSVTPSKTHTHQLLLPPPLSGH